MDNLDLQDRVNKGIRAKQLLNDELLQEAFSMIRDGLNDRELSCRTTDIPTLQDIVRCKQLLVGIERCLYSTIEDGKFAEKELDIQKPKMAVFRR